MVKVICSFIKTYNPIGIINVIMLVVRASDNNWVISTFWREMTDDVKTPT